MTALNKLPAVLDQIEAVINKLTPAMRHNAMINIDTIIAPSFGAGWTTFRTYKIQNNNVVYDDCTEEQFAAFVANKRAMLASHPYVAA